MAKIRFEHLSRTYPGGVQALSDFSLSVKDNELIVIAGVSGSGKTTLLRLISGLDQPDSGEMYIDDRCINEVDPIERGVALVFQNYALYPQMTAKENIALPLKQKHFDLPKLDRHGQPVYTADKAKINALKTELKNADTPEEKQRIKAEIRKEKAEKTCPKYVRMGLAKEEIEKRISEVSTLLELDSFLNQRTSTLSGGQKQRVAIAKALVKQPKILLMDEPLSNLDTKLRGQARRMIRELHDKTGMTTLIVSHDQTDAMTLADRVVVLKEGSVEQIGTPDEIYFHPDNLFVATFFGNPPMNLIECSWIQHKLITNDIGHDEIIINKEQREFIDSSLADFITIGIRPEKIRVSSSGDYLATVEKVELLGRDLVGYFRVFNQTVAAKIEEKYPSGSMVYLSFSSEGLLFFSSKTKFRL